MVLDTMTRYAALSPTCTETWVQLQTVCHGLRGVSEIFSVHGQSSSLNAPTVSRNYEIEVINSKSPELLELKVKGCIGVLIGRKIARSF